MVGIACIVLSAAYAFNRNSRSTEIVYAGPDATPDANFELVSIGDVFNGIARAKTITLTAYSLQPTAVVVRELETAADHGAHVSVALSRGFGMYDRENSETATGLVAHGVRVHVLESTTQSTHIKALILDGELYLSDRNWARDLGSEILIRDRVPGDRFLIERAVLGDSGSNDHLWTRKADALAAEANLLSQTHAGRVQIATESFSATSPIFQQLEKLAGAGIDVDLIVAESEYDRRPSERTAISSLLGSGVKVRLLNSDEKFAVVGNAIWIGSANATGGAPGQIDFGLVVRDGPIADAISVQFEREWRRAKSP